ncbi:MAG: hypothetical protein ACM37U_13110 [Gemmatimonas sp.]
MRKKRLFAIAISAAIAAACSDSTSPRSALTLAPLYHLRSIDGASVPFVSAQGDYTDSGRVIRLGGDTVRVDLVSHSPPANGNPGSTEISFGTWSATQRGNVVVLSPLIASTVDTATISGDTLILRSHEGSLVHVNAYVAP